MLPGHGLWQLLETPGPTASPSWRTRCLFLFSPGCARGMWKFPGQGSNPGHSSDLSRCRDTRSLTRCASGDLQPGPVCASSHPPRLYLALHAVSLQSQSRGLWESSQAALVQRGPCCPRKHAGEMDPGSWDQRPRTSKATARRPQHSLYGQSDPEGRMWPSACGARAHRTSPSEPPRGLGSGGLQAALVSRLGRGRGSWASAVQHRAAAQCWSQQRCTAAAPRMAARVSTMKTTPAIQTP